MKKIETPEDLLPLVKSLTEYGLVVYDHGIVRQEKEKKLYLTISLENLDESTQIQASGIHGRQVILQWRMKK